MKEDKIYTFINPINLNETDTSNRKLSLKYVDPLGLDASSNLKLKYDASSALYVSGNLKITNPSQWTSGK